MNKQEVITFKVDHSLLEALKGISNRSEFIRNAIIAALDAVCPLCKGTGLMTIEQKKHWEEFTRYHHIKICEKCEQPHMVCEATPLVNIHSSK